VSGRRLGAVMLILICGVSVVTVLGGRTEHLPDVALGSVALLEIERVAVATVALALVVTVVVRSAEGKLPTRFSSDGVEYSPEMGPADLERRVSELEQYRERPGTETVGT
jgi:hypothetical protein